MSVNLNALDDRHSLLWANTGGTVQGFSYSPFGGTPARGNSLLPGFNGERLDPVSQTYHLGNGYRTYNPVLMRFNAPDSWSPFGAGGLNQYAYCAGDPINRTDPSGHLSGQAWAGIGLGILGLLGAIFSAGMSIAAAGGAMAAISAASAVDLATGGLGVLADLTSIATGATSEADPEASQVLGWVSFGLGMVGAVAGVAHAGRAVHAKFKQRMGPTDLVSDEGGIELQPLTAPTGDVQADAAFADVSLPGPSTSRAFSDLNTLRDKPFKNPELIKYDSEIDGGRVTRTAQGNLEYEDGVPVVDGNYHYAFSQDHRMYFSRDRRTYVERNYESIHHYKKWISVNVMSAGQLRVRNGLISDVLANNTHYREARESFRISARRMYDFGFTDRGVNLRFDDPSNFGLTDRITLW